MNTGMFIFCACADTHIHCCLSIKWVDQGVVYPIRLFGYLAWLNNRGSTVWLLEIYGNVNHLAVGLSGFTAMNPKNHSITITYIPLSRLQACNKNQTVPSGQGGRGRTTSREHKIILLSQASFYIDFNVKFVRLVTREV